MLGTLLSAKEWPHGDGEKQLAKQQATIE